MRNALTLTAAIVFAAAAWRTSMLAAADWLARVRSADTVRAALRLTPDDSELHAMLGMLAAVSDPPGSRAALERAITLNARNAEAMVNLALEAEAHGDAARAGSLLARTTAVSRRFRPLWTRAGYEYRQGHLEEFWRSAGEAANVEHAAVAPVFRLCARTGASPSETLARLRLSNPGALTSFVAFAVERQDPEAIAAAAIRVAAFGREADTELLFTACERLIDTGAAEQSTTVWNAIVRAGVTSLRRIDAASGAVGANTDCEPGPLRGFDWRVKQAPGVSVVRAGMQGGFRVEFSGRQPERVQVLEQALAVMPESLYELRIAHPELPAAPAGLRWRVIEIPSGADLTPDAPALRHARDHVIRFATGSTTRLARLIFEYERAPGTIRLADSVVVRSLTIWRLPS